jgi:hypothetical protein
MISGNGVRDDRPLRAIQDLIAKLESVNRQLSFKARTMPAPRTPVPADALGHEGPGTADRD